MGEWSERGGQIDMLFCAVGGLYMSAGQDGLHPLLQIVCDTLTPTH